MNLCHSTAGKRLSALSLSIIFLLNLSLTGCSSISSETSSNKKASLSFEEFCNTLFCSEVSSNTINLHFTLSNPESYGITDPPITLGEISHSASDKTNADIENTLASLEQFQYETLSTSDQLTYDILSDYLNHELSGTEYYLYEEYLNPASGIQSQLPILYEEYRFYDEKDVKDYLELLPQTKSYFEEIIAFEQEKAKAGLFMSDTTCDTLIEQCASFTENQENHYLIETFNHKVDALTDINASTKEAYKEENENLVKEYIFPAYDELSAALTNLKGSGKNEKGLCYFDKGKDYYEYLVYYNTGCQAEIKDIQTMIGNQRLLDLQEASKLTQEYPDLWEQCENFALSDTDAVSILNTLQKKMLSQFPAAPETEFTVSYIDKCMEDYLAPAFYITSPIDHYKQNSIFINGTTDNTTMRYFTTLAHEGFPGHLYQTVMSYEMGLPAVRSILNYPGYAEGWATYVEMLSYQYADLPKNAATLMALNQSALLSLYASTDIGIHYEGWTLSDTVKFWKDYGITDENSIAEVYQYIISEPTNYLKYYVGYLGFLELKDYAKDTFQEKYNDVDFHRAVLAIGPAPFHIVEKYLPAFYEIEQ
ncbi:MAG: DUF885 domain-containing protein [Clostridiales bacterium]|nr:DUF885 domain-containing protein [Clostridiales bacterium]